MKAILSTAKERLYKTDACFGIIYVLSAWFEKGDGCMYHSDGSLAYNGRWSGDAKNGYMCLC